MLRFSNPFTMGLGGDTMERETRFGSMTLDEIIAQIKGSAPDSAA